MKKRTLIVATSSYAGMGPYVSEIVNVFENSDNVRFFFVETMNNFYSQNVKKPLLKNSFFFYTNNSIFEKLKDLFGSQKNAFAQAVINYVVQEKISIVHFINFGFNTYLIHKLQDMGIAVLQTVHDLHPHETKKAFHKTIRFKLRMKRMNQILNETTYFVTNSYFQYEELKNSFRQAKVHFHDFPTLVSFQVKNGTVIPPEINNIEKRYILFFGRIEEYKGVKYLYEAFINSEELSKQYYLVIAGKGELPFKHLKNDKIVIINRYIKDEEISTLYQNAACVVYPYISATQSGVMSLSCFFQIPTLVSDIPYFKSIVKKNGVADMFENRNVSDLQKKLIKLLKSDTNTMKNYQGEYYKSHFGKDVIRMELLKIYDSI